MSFLNLKGMMQVRDPSHLMFTKIMGELDRRNNMLN